MRERRAMLSRSLRTCRVACLVGRAANAQMGGNRANPRHCGKQTKRAGLAALSGADRRRSSDRQSARKHKPLALGSGSL